MKKITTFLICLITLFVQAQNLTAFHEEGIYLYGLKNSAGKIVVQPKYDYHEYMEFGMIKMRLDNKWTLFDSTGKEINIYDRIYDFEYVKDLKGKCARVEKNYKAGYIDTSGKEVISPIYSMGGFSEGLASVWASEHHYGYMDVHGILAIDTTLNYHGVSKFSNGKAEVWLAGYLYDGTGNIITDEAKISGYIDKTGKEVIPLKYQAKQEYFKIGTETLLLHSVNKSTPGQQTYIGSKPSQQLAETFKNESGKYGFKRNKYLEEYGMYEIVDTIIIHAKYDTVYQTVYDDLGNEIFKKGYFLVEISGKKGLVDSLGNQIVPVKYDWINFSFLGREYVEVKLNGKIGLINKLGKEVIAPAYDAVGFFSEELAWVQPKQGGNYGYINTNGNLVIDTILRYKTVGNFSDGLAMVAVDSIDVETGSEYRLFGFIDKKAKEIISVKYTSAEDFKNGKAKVQINTIDKNFVKQTKKLYIDKNGNEIK